MNYMVPCAPTQHPSSCDARVERHQGVGESFSGAHACPEYPRIDSQSIWRLLFFDENYNFGEIRENPWKSMIWGDFGYPGWNVRQLSWGVGEAREIITHDAGRRRRPPRGRKHVRNVSSDAPATFYSEWNHLEAMAWISFFCTFFNILVYFLTFFCTNPR